MGLQSKKTLQCELSLERPRFGQVIRQIAGVTSQDICDSLELQQQAGGRLGEILLQRELVSREQIFDALRVQAHWIADMMRADISPKHFPYPAFFSLCLPAYNEAENIVDTLESACAILPVFVEQFEVIVVDDGSTDGTGDVVAEFSEDMPHVRLVRHEMNRGYGAAVTSGLREADGDLVAFTDSDGQFSYLDLPQFLSRLHDNDMVIGYRYPRSDPWIRGVNAWCWNRLVRTLLGVRVRDLDCAFKVFSRRVIDCLNLSVTGQGINAEIMAQCQRGGLRIAEIPVTHYPRYHGVQTGAGLPAITRAFQELPQLLKYRGQQTSFAEPTAPECEQVVP